MRLRKFLVVGSAVAAAAAAMLVPTTAQATDPHGPIVSVTGAGPVSMTAKLPLSVKMKVYGSWVTLGCSSGSAGGTATSGPSPWLNVTSLNLTCTSFIPGSTVSISIPASGCATATMADNNVHTGLVDTGRPKGGKYDGVSGALTFGTGCDVTVVADICTVKLGGSINLKFHEAVKPNGSQDLDLFGTGLVVRSRTAGCLGAVSVGENLDMGTQAAPGVTMNLFATNGPVDFRPIP